MNTKPDIPPYYERALHTLKLSIMGILLILFIGELVYSKLTHNENSGTEACRKNDSIIYHSALKAKLSRIEVAHGPYYYYFSTGHYKSIKLFSVYSQYDTYIGGHERGEQLAKKGDSVYKDAGTYYCWVVRKDTAFQMYFHLPNEFYCCPN